jgi:hypothetical protein
MPYAGRHQPWRERVGDYLPVGREATSRSPPEHCQALHAIGVSTRQPLHERRQVGVVGPELVGLSPPSEHAVGAYELHQHEQEERLRDVEREGCCGDAHRATLP